MPADWPVWRYLLLAAAWLLLLAALPWWVDLALLLAAAIVLLGRPGAREGLLRRVLRWGLPGLLLSLLRAFGGDARAWLFTLLAALVGFSLLTLLEGWLNHRQQSAPPEVTADGTDDREWPSLALAPSGPPAQIIELQLPHWQALDHPLDDPLGGELDWCGGALQLADGSLVAGVEPRCEFGSDGRWLALPLAGKPGLMLLDRRRRRRHRLRGWQLCGWHEGVPWLSRDDERGPQPVAHVLGSGGDG